MHTHTFHPTRILALLLTLLLAACGAATSTTPGVDRSDPAAVNAAWVRAIEANDRAAALALIDAGDEQATTFNTDQYLSSMADHIHPAAGRADPAGAFEGVEPLDVRPIGAGMRAYSRWNFAKRDRCYYAELAQSGGQWIVTAWYATADASECEGGA